MVSSLDYSIQSHDSTRTTVPCRLHNYWTNICNYLSNIIHHTSATLIVYSTPSIHIIIFTLHLSKSYHIEYLIYTPLRLVYFVVACPYFLVRIFLQLYPTSIMTQPRTLP